MGKANDCSMTETNTLVGNVRHIDCACVFDSGDASFSKAIATKFEGVLLHLCTNPGSVAPDANYDITLLDALGADRLGGSGANRHTSNNEVANVVYSSTSVHPVVDEDDELTLTFTGNTTVSALVALSLYYQVP
mgnify:CR=1 FL=1